jgi:hypothetical protein
MDKKYLEKQSPSEEENVRIGSESTAVILGEDYKHYPGGG